MPLSLNQLGNSAPGTQAKFGNGTSIYYIYIGKAECQKPTANFPTANIYSGSIVKMQ